MNKAQKTLLKELREDSRETELLSSVKKSIDPLGRLHGDIRFKAEVLITVRTEFYQNFILIAPAVLPGVLQTYLPVFIFGLTDYYGVFKKSQSITGLGNWERIHDVFIGLDNDPRLPWASGNAWEQGDLIVHLNCMHPIGGGIFVRYDAYIFIHCNNVAYGTFLNSFVSDLIILNQIQYNVGITNEVQFINPLIFTTQSLFGKLKTETLDPRTYVTNQTFNQYIANIPIALPIDKSLIMSTRLNYDIQEINFLLQVQKVKPLTFR